MHRYRKPKKGEHRMVLRQEIRYAADGVLRSGGLARDIDPEVYAETLDALTEAVLIAVERDRP
jgi:hypothetical protein